MTIKCQYIVLKYKEGNEKYTNENITRNMASEIQPMWVFRRKCVCVRERWEGWDGGGRDRGRGAIFIHGFSINNQIMIRLFKHLFSLSCPNRTHFLINNSKLSREQSRLSDKEAFMEVNSLKIPSHLTVCPQMKSTINYWLRDNQRFPANIENKHTNIEHKCWPVHLALVLAHTMNWDSPVDIYKIVHMSHPVSKPNKHSVFL